jgi:hypothetical protein
MIQLREQYWAYPMPDAEGVEIRGEHPGRPYQMLSFYGEADAVRLPPGTWEIVCMSHEASDKQAASIVEETEYGYRGYDVNNDNVLHWRYAYSSLKSLLTSRGCDLNKNWLILKKQ